MAEKPEHGTRFERWKEAEAIAMHFNGLLIRLRSQALGILATLGAGGAFLASSTLRPEVLWLCLAGHFTFLLCLWGSLYLLDKFYYGKLLNGAVIGVIEIELQSAEHLFLSRRIERALTGVDVTEFTDERIRSLAARGHADYFYLAVTLTLAFAAAVCLLAHYFQFGFELGGLGAAR